LTSRGWYSVAAYELNDQSKLALTDQRLDRPHDPLASVEQQTITHLKRLLDPLVPGRDQFVPASKLVSIFDRAHRGVHRSRGGRATDRARRLVAAASRSGQPAA